MHTNMHIAEIPEGEEREKGAENIFEDIITENFPIRKGHRHLTCFRSVILLIDF